MGNLTNYSTIITLNNHQDVCALKTLCNLNDTELNKLTSICDLISYPITVILENYYIDKVYRDTYYSYFSKKHFSPQNTCKRLSFFKKTFTKEMFFNADDSFDKELQSNFVGTMVIKPLLIGKIGRTLLDPKKLNLSKSYIRTTNFTVEILGKSFMINSFPFSEQDSETMTCAETTIWGILEYYGTRYPEYKTILPSDIIKSVDSISKQRVLPSNGLDYYTVSNTLKSFGFQPRVYALESFDNDSEGYKQIFHYYVESGIPIGVGTCLPDDNAGHSTICIGHGEPKYNLTSNMFQNFGNLSFVNTCYFYDDYVIIDDNQIPYTIENFKNFTLYNNAYVDVFVVPLHKRIFLEADMIKEMADNLFKLFADSIEKLLNLQQIEYDNSNDPIVNRILLTSSRKFKMVRNKNSTTLDEKKFYGNIAFPKFLWIIELSTLTMYQGQEVFGEIVLDATSPIEDITSNIISFRIGSFIGYRLPDETFTDLWNRFITYNKNFCNKYSLYVNNLN